MLRVAFSALYWAIAVAVMPPLQVVALAIWLLTVWWDRRRLLLHLYCCGWGYLYVFMNPFWRVRFEGRERLPWIHHVWPKHLRPIPISDEILIIGGQQPCQRVGASTPRRRGGRHAC